MSSTRPIVPSTSVKGRRASGGRSRGDQLAQRFGRPQPRRSSRCFSSTSSSAGSSVTLRMSASSASLRRCTSGWPGQQVPHRHDVADDPGQRQGVVGPADRHPAAARRPAPDRPAPPWAGASGRTACCSPGRTRCPRSSRIPRALSLRKSYSKVSRPMRAAPTARNRVSDTADRQHQAGPALDEAAQRPQPAGLRPSAGRLAGRAGRAGTAAPASR